MFTERRKDTEKREKRKDTDKKHTERRKDIEKKTYSKEKVHRERRKFTEKGERTERKEGNFLSLMMWSKPKVAKVTISFDKFYKTFYICNLRMVAIS